MMQDFRQHWKVASLQIMKNMKVQIHIISIVQQFLWELCWHKPGTWNFWKKQEKLLLKKCRNLA